MRRRQPSSTIARARARRRADLFGTFVTRDAGAAAKIDVIRRGVAAGVVEGMAAYFDVSKTEIFSLLHAPESTGHRLIKDDSRLDSATTERIVRVADAARLAQRTFGGRAAATSWLKAPNLALRGATPLSMLDTEPGAAEVRRILAGIEYGGVF